MQQYLDLLRSVLEEGHVKEDRTGTGTISRFGGQLRFDLSEGFPLVTTKRVHMKSVIHELLWFIAGTTNVKPLQENGVSIWDEWADEEGELGPVYGKQWRRWRTAEGNEIDQLKEAIESIRRDPSSRRHLVSAWNVGEISEMKLPPCHLLYQFDVSDGKLSCGMYQRSCDLFLGVPFNIASYALLTLMVAQATDLQPGDSVISMGDMHIYSNHVDQVRTQLERTPRERPTLRLDPSIKSVFDFRFEHFHLEDYAPHPTIKAPIAV